MTTVTQTWHDMFSLHWSVAADVVRARLPANVALETWRGEAWVSVVAMRARFYPPASMPLSNDVSAICTYVRHERRPALCVLTMDMSTKSGTSAARWLGLPVRHSEIALGVRDDSVRFNLRRSSFSGATFFARGNRARGWGGTCHILHRFLSEREAILWKRGPLLVEMPIERFSGGAAQRCDIVSIYDRIGARETLQLRPMPDVALYDSLQEVRLGRPRVHFARPGQPGLSAAFEPPDDPRPPLVVCKPDRRRADHSAA